MDELREIRELRAELETPDADARTVARAALEARFTTSAADVGPRPVARRRQLSLAVATMLALAGAVALAVVLLDGGARTDTAVADPLLAAAEVAESGSAEAPPGPGQFVFRRLRSVGFEVWDPAHPARAKEELGPNLYAAMAPSEVESWISPDGRSRFREHFGPLRFLSAAERRRWLAAGKPVPPAQLHGDRDLRTGKGSGGYLDTTGLPTDPDRLRKAIEAHAIPGLLYGHSTDGDFVALWAILSAPYSSPQLRAAAFRLGSELPGVTVLRHVHDLAGRSGDAIAFRSRRHGIRTELLFDPATSKVLGERVVLEVPRRAPTQPERELEPGTVVWSVAYLEARVVDASELPPWHR